jgi:transcriptional regulator
MYVPRPFAPSAEVVRELLGAISVGHLVTATATGPQATLVPWVVDADGQVLVGHLARPNPQWMSRTLGEALVVCGGPNAYVSPSWYATKAEHGRVVPTWDYLTLQLFGTLIVHDDPGWVENAVRRLTDHHEATRDDPWSVDDAPRDYINGQLLGIVGIEFQVRRVEASLKMSQNRSPQDVDGVVAGLIADGRPEVAELVRQAAT